MTNEQVERLLIERTKDDVLNAVGDLIRSIPRQAVCRCSRGVEKACASCRVWRAYHIYRSKFRLKRQGPENKQ